MSTTATKTKVEWVIVKGSKVVGGTHPSRQAARDHARDKSMEGFKVVKATDAPKSKSRPSTAKRAGAKKSTGGYVPATRRKCGLCGHYRKRDDQVLTPMEVTFDRGGKEITQTRQVAICDPSKGGCRDNTR